LEDDEEVEEDIDKDSILAANYDNLKKMDESLIKSSDAFIGCKLKQIAFVLVFKSKKQNGLICFSFGFKKTKVI
jgi:hypothetical protein